jgi:hypothetical protein
MLKNLFHFEIRSDWKELLKITIPIKLIEFSGKFLLCENL